MESKELKTKKLSRIGCDGTVINAGGKIGVITRIGRRLKRPLHWIICQHQGNELPLRHLVQKLDGPITGFTGEDWKAIGKLRIIANT